MKAGPWVQSSEGVARPAAVATTRMRLRRVGGGDIMTGLQTGQVITVPINVRLDVWAEIVRLESDRARLVVDWGNGNLDFSGCGACRIENTYTRTGRYTLTAKVVDLNAAAGSETISLAVVTIDVIDPVTLACAPLGDNFDSLPSPTLLPAGLTGVRVTGAGSFFNVGSLFGPVAENVVLVSDDGLTVFDFTFDGPKTSLTVSAITASVGEAVLYQAFNEQGAIVASASTVLNTGFTGFGIGAVSISAPPFKRVLFSTNSAGGFALDRLNASCN